MDITESPFYRSALPPEQPRIIVCSGMRCHGKITLALDVVRELDHQVRGAQEPDWKLEIRLIEVGESIEGSDRRSVGVR